MSTLQVRGIRGRRGVSLLEYALVLPLLVLLAVGVSDLSASWRIKHLLTEAAREGARVASATPNLQANDPRVLVVVDDIVQTGGIAPGDYEVRLGFPQGIPGASAAPGTPVTVTVAHQGLAASGSALSPLWQGFELEASSTMRYEMRIGTATSGTAQQLPPMPGPPSPAPQGPGSGT